MSTNDQKIDFTFAYVMLAAICLVPAVLGSGLFILSLPFFYATYKYWRSRYYWLGIGVVAAVTLNLLFFTGAYEYFHLYDWRELYDYCFGKTALWFNMQLGLPGRFAMRLARFVVGTGMLAPLFAYVAIPILVLFRFKEVMFGKRVEGLATEFEIAPRVFKKHRDRGEGALIGVTRKKKPLYLSDNDRIMHTQVIGSTGFGKTASVLSPLLRHDLLRGKGMVIVDGKGDRESFSTILSLARECGRENDLLVFSPVYPEVSLKWNPLLRGRDIEIKDRIIGAQRHTEEYYKKKSEVVLVDLINVLHHWGEAVSFPKLQTLLDKPVSDFSKNRVFSDKRIEARFTDYCEHFKTEAKNLAGISADLNLFSNSNIGHLFTAEPGVGIDLMEAYFSGKVVYFHLPVLSLEETAHRIGRMVIHDLKTLVGYVQTGVDPERRRHFPVYIDEFASFASESFIELLNKARSSKVALTLIHQSLGDIDKISPSFARQLSENTNIKVVLRIDDPVTIEMFCRMAGTKMAEKYTYQTQRGVWGPEQSGGASMREVDEFVIDPNVFRRLRIGQAVVMVKTKRLAEVVKLDFIMPKLRTLQELGITNVPDVFMTPMGSVPIPARQGTSSAKIDIKGALLEDKNPDKK